MCLEVEVGARFVIVLEGSLSGKIKEGHLKWNAEVWWCYSNFFELQFVEHYPKILPVPLSV